MQHQYCTRGARVLAFAFLSWPCLLYAQYNAQRGLNEMTREWQQREFQSRQEWREFQRQMDLWQQNDILQEQNRILEDQLRELRRQSEQVERLSRQQELQWREQRLEQTKRDALRLRQYLEQIWEKLVAAWQKEQDLIDTELTTWLMLTHLQPQVLLDFEKKLPDGDLLATTVLIQIQANEVLRVLGKIISEQVRSTVEHNNKFKKMEPPFNQLVIQIPDPPFPPPEHSDLTKRLTDLGFEQLSRLERLGFRAKVGATLKPQTMPPELARVVLAAYRDNEFPKLRGYARAVEFLLCLCIPPSWETLGEGR